MGPVFSEADETLTPELRLLLASARVAPTENEIATIRRMLADGVDWTLFATKAVEHGLVTLVGRTLRAVAPDLVAPELLDAFQVHASQTTERNTGLFAELTRITRGLSEHGVETIPFKGPVTAIQAYGDLSLREFRDLDFLVRDVDIRATLESLQKLGYRRRQGLTDAQLELIHRIQGQEIVTSKAIGLVVEPHTRLTSAKLALDIDYAGLWRRATSISLNGERFLTLAPEDHLILLAIHGGKELWWRMNWACDVAALIAAHPKLDWTAILERARAQGCRRMVLLASSLAHLYFKARIPDDVLAAERRDPALADMVRRLTGRWLSDGAGGPPNNRFVSADLLRLHDGTLRRVRYAARTWFLPAPAHVAWLPLPRRMGFAYVPLKLIHDTVLLPVWRAYWNVLNQAKRARDVVLRSDLALALLPATPERKVILEMRAEAKRGLAADPTAVWAWLKQGDALIALKRCDEAIRCYERALSFQPDHMLAWRKLGEAKKNAGQQKNPDEFTPTEDTAHAWAMRAGFLAASRRYMEASDASERALELDPSYLNAERIGIHSRLFACDWRRRDEDAKRALWGIGEGLRILNSIDLLRICDLSHEDCLSAARLFGKSRSRAAPLWNGERYRHDKIRIAYLSSDFQDHVVADAIVGCFEHHDKTRFETTGISFGPNDDSGVRRRIAAAFDRFIDVEATTDGRAAAMLRDLEIDIAVDLNGYTAARRTGIFARKAAPVQVNYLGYPGTMALPFMDYIIADKIVIPEEERVHYSEKVAYLPNSFFPADNKRPILEDVPSRRDEGLPAAGFVFACHNDERKIGPQMFDIWMRLLRGVEGSVLSLRALHPSAISNLRREAAARGIDPARLVFAPRRKRRMAHLARLKLADLFLDTLPYNAHATACDALWAGLPVLTCTGNAFYGRVAASLLHAVGLPELVTATLGEYEQTALALALDPACLSAIKTKLERNRISEPLFDTAYYTRNLESAYVTMWERQQAGLLPEGFSVA